MHHGLMAHLTDLEYHLNVHRPHIVMIQETWLDASIEEIQFFFRSHGYRLERWSEGWIVIDPLGGKVELGGDHEVSLHASKMIVRKKNGLFSPEYNVR